MKARNIEIGNRQYELNIFSKPEDIAEFGDHIGVAAEASDNCAFAMYAQGSNKMSLWGLGHAAGNDSANVEGEIGIRLYCDNDTIYEEDLYIDDVAENPHLYECLKIIDKHY